MPKAAPVVILVAARAHANPPVASQTPAPAKPSAPTCADGRDDTLAGDFGYGGHGPGGVRTGFMATSICFGDVTRDLEALRANVVTKAIPLKVCYENVLDLSPLLAGTATATFIVGADGHVTGAHATGVEPRVDACVARELAKLTFATPVDGAPASISIPITFRPPKR